VYAAALRLKKDISKLDVHCNFAQSPIPLAGTPDFDASTVHCIWASHLLPRFEATPYVQSGQARRYASVGDWPPGQGGAKCSELSWEFQRDPDHFNLESQFNRNVSEHLLESRGYNVVPQDVSAAAFEGEFSGGDLPLMLMMTAAPFVKFHPELQTNISKIATTLTNKVRTYPGCELLQVHVSVHLSPQNSKVYFWNARRGSYAKLAMRMQVIVFDPLDTTFLNRLPLLCRPQILRTEYPALDHPYRDRSVGRYEDLTVISPLSAMVTHDHQKRKAALLDPEEWKTSPLARVGRSVDQMYIGLEASLKESFIASFKV
jgi:hypothetical protein